MSGFVFVVEEEICKVLATGDLDTFSDWVNGNTFFEAGRAMAGTFCNMTLKEEENGCNGLDEETSILYEAI